MESLWLVVGKSILSTGLMVLLMYAAVGIYKKWQKDKLKKRKHKEKVKRNSR